ncbi:MAG: AMP-binding protein [Pseudomonadota bacterium]
MSETRSNAQSDTRLDPVPSSDPALAVPIEGIAGPVTADKKTTRSIDRQSNRSILHAFLTQARKSGAKTLAVIDGDGRKLTYGDLTRAVFGLSGPIARQTAPGENVGLMLPTGAGVLISCFALHATGRVPAMLNFTSGEKNLKLAGQAAEVKTVLTARKFIEVAKLHGLVENLSTVYNFLYLEDLKDQVGLTDKIKAVLGPILPSLYTHHPQPDDNGVILFTSGTEGTPKGVVLSHKNVLANVAQISAHVDLEKDDIFFNPLPAFHCYGLTAGSLWPVISGHPVVFHPSPLQTKIIPKRIFETDSSVLFATDTFLQQYMRASDEGGMSSLRIAVCGAERVRDETRQAAERKFAFKVLEGYGVTEAAPVLAANQPEDIRNGTVGKLLPTVESRLEPVGGLDAGGRLFVRGPNVMKGYLFAEQPGKIQKRDPADWYDTGDVVTIDKEGYVSIRGRMKRFAKIGGEMISLTVVENCASAVWPDNMHAAAIVPDPKKGEQIVLVTDQKEPERASLLRWAQSHGVPEIAVPKKIVSVDAIPVLGTGKTDFVSVTNLAKAAVVKPVRAQATGETTDTDEKNGDQKKGAAASLTATGPEEAAEHQPDVNGSTPRKAAE